MIGMCRQKVVRLARPSWVKDWLAHLGAAFSGGGRKGHAAVGHIAAGSSPRLGWWPLPAGRN